MALAAERVLERINHALGGSPASELSPLEIANDAGLHFENLYQWKFFEHEVGDINAVADQDYLELPSDFRSLIHITPANGLTRSLQIVSLKQLNILRTTTIQVTTYNYYGAVYYPDSSVSQAPAVPRLGIWPTPVANETAAFKVMYSAGWRRLTDNDDFCNIPDWAEPAYLELVATYARGLDALESDPLDVMLARYQQSPILLAAMRRDKLVQGGELGEMQGGAVASDETRAIQFWDGGTAAPS